MIQEKAIPLLLEGKDVLIRARTGSGKTGAFAVPLIQKILLNKRMQEKQEIKGLIVAPSKELCKQIYEVIISLTIKCHREVRVIDISPQVDLNTQKPLLSEMPDIVVATSSRLLQHLKAGNLILKHSLETLIIDEADLVYICNIKRFQTKFCVSCNMLVFNVHYTRIPLIISDIFIWI